MRVHTATGKTHVNRQQQIQAEYDRYIAIKAVANAKGYQVWPWMAKPRLNEEYQITNLEDHEPQFSGRRGRVGMYFIDGVEDIVRILRPRPGF